MVRFAFEAYGIFDEGFEGLHLPACVCFSLKHHTFQQGVTPAALNQEPVTLFGIFYYFQQLNPDLGDCL